MRFRFAFLFALLPLTFGSAALVLAGAGCSSSSVQKPPPLVVTDDDAAGRDSAPPPVDLDAAPPPPTDSGPASGTIYVHTGRTLFLFEPYAKTLKKIGDFSCLTDAQFSEVGDIAVNRDGEIYGATLNDGFIKIDPLTAGCTVIATSANRGFPNSLSFVPRGTLDPANDALVGYFRDEYVRIDVATGKITSIGLLNPNDASTTYESSGDIVSVGADRTYLSAKTFKSGFPVDGGDVLVRFDPKTGRRIQVSSGTTNRVDIWGMGYWAGMAYGFTAKGEAVAIDPTTGAATNIPVDAGTRSTQGVFYGAGSTTIAPTR